MTKEVMTRKASDNEYLHKDFHGALSAGIEYLHDHFGEEAVRDFLRCFAETFYAPLRKKLAERGLVALKEHFENIYTLEKGTFSLRMTDDELILTVEACPAVQHMRKQGYFVARLFHETTNTVNHTLCEGTPFAFELLSYEPETGRSVQRFYRRKK